jgi:hypothetical protein
MRGQISGRREALRILATATDPSERAMMAKRALAGNYTDATAYYTLRHERAAALAQYRRETPLGSR